MVEYESHYLNKDHNSGNDDKDAEYEFLDPLVFMAKGVFFGIKEWLTPVKEVEDQEN